MSGILLGGGGRVAGMRALSRGLVGVGVVPDGDGMVGCSCDPTQADGRLAWGTASVVVPLEPTEGLHGAPRVLWFHSSQQRACMGHRECCDPTQANGRLEWGTPGENILFMSAATQTVVRSPGHNLSQIRTNLKREEQGTDGAGALGGAPALRVRARIPRPPGRLPAQVGEAHWDHPPPSACSFPLRLLPLRGARGQDDICSLGWQLRGSRL
jgi:hypothetical protein